MSIKKMKFIIEYAGVDLPIIKNEAGIHIVPLKALVEAIGVSWKMQHRKLTSDTYFERFYGTCIHHVMDAGGQKRDVFCMRLDSIAHYLNSISPVEVRAKGNIAAADWLEAKQKEWRDVMHDYEEAGIAVNPNHADQIEGRRKLRASLCQLIGMKNKCAHKEDRKILSGEIADVAGQLGHTYQPDLLDDGADKKPGASDQPDLLELAKKEE